MKIQPLQQIADHIVRWRDAGNSEMAQVDADIRSLKWKLCMDRPIGRSTSSRR